MTSDPFLHPITLQFVFNEKNSLFYPFLEQVIHTWQTTFQSLPHLHVERQLNKAICWNVSVPRDVLTAFQQHVPPPSTPVHTPGADHSDPCLSPNTTLHPTLPGSYYEALIDFLDCLNRVPCGSCGSEHLHIFAREPLMLLVVASGALTGLNASMPPFSPPLHFTPFLGTAPWNLSLSVDATLKSYGPWISCGLFFEKVVRRRFGVMFGCLILTASLPFLVSALVPHTTWARLLPFVSPIILFCTLIISPSPSMCSPSCRSIQTAHWITRLDHLSMSRPKALATIRRLLQSTDHTGKAQLFWTRHTPPASPFPTSPCVILHPSENCLGQVLSASLWWLVVLAGFYGTLLLSSLVDQILGVSSGDLVSLTHLKAASHAALWPNLVYGAMTRSLKVLIICLGYLTLNICVGFTSPLLTCFVFCILGALSVTWGGPTKLLFVPPSFFTLHRLSLCDSCELATHTLHLFRRLSCFEFATALTLVVHHVRVLHVSSSHSHLHHWIQGLKTQGFEVLLLVGGLSYKCPPLLYFPLWLPQMLSIFTCLGNPGVIPMLFIYLWVTPPVFHRQVVQASSRLVPFQLFSTLPFATTDTNAAFIHPALDQLFFFVKTTCFLLLSTFLCPPAFWILTLWCIAWHVTYFANSPVETNQRNTNLPLKTPLLQDSPRPTHTDTTVQSPHDSLHHRSATPSQAVDKFLDKPTLHPPPHPPPLTHPSPDLHHHHKALLRFSGTWRLLKGQSDSFSQVSKELGLSWVIRQVMEQFTPSCEYHFIDTSTLRITSFLPMNRTYSILLYLDDTDHTSQEEYLGSWITRTVYQSQNKCLVSYRTRSSDALVVEEKRQILQSKTSPNDTSQDILWYAVKLQVPATQSSATPRQHTANRYFERINADTLTSDTPLSYVAPSHPSSTESSAPPPDNHTSSNLPTLTVIASLDELPEYPPCKSDSSRKKTHPCPPTHLVHPQKKPLNPISDPTDSTRTPLKHSPPPIPIAPYVHFHQLNSDTENSLLQALHKVRQSVDSINSLSSPVMDPNTIPCLSKAQELQNFPTPQPLAPWLTHHDTFLFWTSILRTESLQIERLAIPQQPPLGRSTIFFSSSLPLNQILDRLFSPTWIKQVNPSIDQSFTMYSFAPDTIMAYQSYHGGMGLSGREFVFLAFRCLSNDQRTGTIALTSHTCPHLESPFKHLFSKNVVRGQILRAGYHIKQTPFTSNGSSTVRLTFLVQFDPHLAFVSQLVVNLIQLACLQSLSRIQQFLVCDS